MSSTKRDKYVSELQEVFSTQGPQLFDGRLSLCLTNSCLHYLMEKFTSLSDDPNDSTDLRHLFKKFSKLMSLKLIPDKKRTVAPSLVNLNLSPFRALLKLEIKKVPVRSLKGLHRLREQLKVLIIERSSVTSLECVLVQCAGDNASARVWTNLIELDLSVNAIELIDTSLMYLPVVEKLNLSNNLIGQQTPPQTVPGAKSTISATAAAINDSGRAEAMKEAVSGTQYLNKVRSLYLGFNQLSVIPVFSEKAKYTLTTLVLRNNHLHKVEGIEALDTLKVLDLAQNLISLHSELKPLLVLHHLNELSLTGNPCVYDPQHRLKVAENLSRLVDASIFKLDGKKLSSTEKKGVVYIGPREFLPLNQLSTPSSCSAHG